MYGSLDFVGDRLRRARAIVAKAAIFFTVATFAQASPFESGWTLKSNGSSLTMQSIKNLTKVESSDFSNFGGAILPDGHAEVTIDLGSVDTKVDLRNVRMRFLFFETYLYPTAKVTTRLRETDFEDLAETRRKTIKLPYTLSLHGVEKDLEAVVTITLLSDDLVSVATNTPISIDAATFGLSEGIARLEAAAGVKLIPSATVAFDFLFERHSDGVLTAAPELALVTPNETAESAANAVNAEEAAAKAAAEENASAGQVETAAVSEPAPEPFSALECEIRFKVIKQIGEIRFADDGRAISPKSIHVLDQVTDLIRRCPDSRVEIGSHSTLEATDERNETVSQAKANLVRDFLSGNGVASERLVAVGYGAAFPVAVSGATATQFNDRIEFTRMDR